MFRDAGKSHRQTGSEAQGRKSDAAIKAFAQKPFDDLKRGYGIVKRFEIALANAAKTAIIAHALKEQLYGKRDVGNLGLLGTASENTLILNK